MLKVYTPETVVDSNAKLLKLADFTSSLDVPNSSSPDRIMSGYVSVATPDLVNDIIPSGAWNKHLWRYKNNPVYCFMHDHLQPIGKVGNAYTDDKGLYLENIQLSDIPLVRDVLWPMLKDGSLKQQSVGFKSLKGRYLDKGQFYEHTECYLLESSLVTVACNPDAMLDQIKHICKHIPEYEQIYSNDFDKFTADYSSGKLPMLSDIRKDFYMSDLKPTEKETPTVPVEKTTPVEITKLAYHEACQPTPEEEFDGDQLANDDLFLVKQIANNKISYLLRFGTQTKSDIVVDFSDLAVAMYRLLGAKTDFKFVDGERESAIKRACALYRKSEKQVPQYDGVDLDTLEDATLYDTLKYDRITFRENEVKTFEIIELENSLAAANNITQKWLKNGQVDETVIDTLLKYVYSVFEVYVSINEAEDANMVNAIMDAMIAAKEAAEDSMELPSIYEYDIETDTAKVVEGADETPETDQELVDLIKRAKENS